MSLRPLVLLVPSRAAAVELPRRLASTGRALAAVYAMKPLELARALAEPAVVAQGLAPWTNGHDALLAARLLGEPQFGLRLPPGSPTSRVAAALARTLGALRRARVPGERLAALAQRAATAEDKDRLSSLSRLYLAFCRALDSECADPVAVYAAARAALAQAPLLRDAELLVVDDLELDPVQWDFVDALAAHLPLRVLRRELPPSLRAGACRTRLASRGVSAVPWAETPLAAIAPGEPPASLRRLRERLFEPPAGEAVTDGAVELLTAPGEAAETRAIARRLLRAAAAGVPFEEMGVVLARPDVYAPLFEDLLSRLGIPHRLHPSLPLRFGRAARSLLLLFRSRGLERPAVMEFLTFAPVPFAALLGGEAPPRLTRWDQISREAGIVSGLSRWIVGLRAFAEAEREAAEREAEPDRRRHRLGSAADAEALLHVVEVLSATLDTLSGEATWAEWVERLRTACEQWIGPERDGEAVLELVADLGGLGSVASRAAWDDVEQVLEARLEWERLPLEPLAGGAVHIGALDAMAGLPFRVVAIPGLVEGGYPGVFRPDPFLLDPERRALAEPGTPSRPAEPRPVQARRAGGGRQRGRHAQLELFAETPSGPDPMAAEGAGDSSWPSLPTSQDRLLEARRSFQRAVSQAGEQLVLSYPRAEARSGRERLPSLFFAAAASALAGRPLSAGELDAMVVEDEPARLSLDEALDAGERDRLRLLHDEASATAIAAGSVFFRQSRLASKARWSGRLTRYDGLLGEVEDEALRARLDPLQARFPLSASRLATYARCGFLYYLQYVLGLQHAPEPEERRRLDPLERGDLFHRVAEAFLRERRERGELPLVESEAVRERLRAIAEAALERLVQGSPPRFTLLWEREKRRFQQTMQDWLRRETDAASRATPAYFEVAFGLPAAGEGHEPHDPEPLVIDLGEGRSLRVCGRIDRIDRRHEGGLVLRDYKTGRAPRDDGGVFRGGKQLQIPFYVLAAAGLFPQEAVVDAFLDYVDGGRQVAFRPELVQGQAFRQLLGDLVSLLASGVFVQEPSFCELCDFTSVCGPRPILAKRQAIKRGDPSLVGYLRLRDVE